MFRIQKQLTRNASSATVLLPKTDLPLRVNPKNRKERDLWIMENASFDDLYSWQRKALSGKEEFILHDGPPYANGRTHMGHALNKILKDFTNRYHLLAGKQINYIPGWDCHGLPIEIKALESLGSKISDLNALEIREKAKSFAIETIKEQKSSFSRWGVMADWTSGCYYSFNPSYVSKQLQLFYSLHQKKLVYRDYKPVYWSPSSRTALAESELEYKENHASASIYLKLALKNPFPDCINVSKDTPVSIVIWTTTPWTLPANQAVCFSPDERYCLVQSKAHDGQYMVIASQLRTTLEQLWSTQLDVINEFPGSGLTGCRYSHPLLKSDSLPLLPASHVTMSKGTGFVHTAPAHGPEDFLVALQHKIPVLSLVNEEGKFNQDVPLGLGGLSVLDKGQEKVLNIIQDDIVHRERFIHSYPYDWRTKLPVILRASLQWFIDTDSIKDKALEAMKNVTVVPPNLEKPMLTQLSSRPYWCISRQRSWGVPIPVFYNMDTPSNEVILHKEIIDRICNRTEERGIDEWWVSSPEELIGDELIDRFGLKPGSIKKGQDIMDIWFDSGVSWKAVLPEGKQADLYLEGIDQFGGWFQSSLLTSVAATGRAPYKKLYVHGFALDNHGRKMSKSLGNVIDPQDVIDGDGKKMPAYGVDALRWWTASHITGNGSSVPVSKELIQQASDEVQKIRSVMRFILGNMNETSESQLESITMDRLNLTDQYILHLLTDCVEKTLSAYDDMNYKKVSSLMTHFITNSVSAFYCSIVRDRLYCYSVGSEERLAAVYVLSQLLDQITLVLAPILPHLTEEIELYHPLRKSKGGLFRNRRLSNIRKFNNADIVEWMAPSFAVRDSVNQMIGMLNTKEWDVQIHSHSQQDFEYLQKLQTQESTVESPMCELLQVSSVTLINVPSTLSRVDDNRATSNQNNDGVKITETSHSGKIAITLSKTHLKSCPRCRRFISADGQLCSVCLSC